MPDVLHLDYETRSGTDLKLHGLDRYTRDPACAVLIAAWRINNGPIRAWSCADGNRIPAELRDALSDPAVEKWAFNAQFERVVTERILKIKTPVRSWRCTMVLSYMFSFTGGLDEVGQQTGVPITKDKEGRRLINLFSVPRKTDGGFNDWTTHPDDWRKFIEYCRRDVEAEIAIKRFFAGKPILDVEWETYHLDQIINDRGLPVNLDFCRNALAMAARRKEELKKEMKALTGLQNPNSGTQLTKWLRERGYPFHDIGKDTVAKVLREGTCPDETAVKVLELRQWAGKTSDRKFKSILDRAGPDGRVRFIYQFGGASRTNRWAGRGVQTQNLSRTPKALEEEADAERFIGLVLEGEYEVLEETYGEPLSVIPSSIRFAFQTPVGEEFVVCDYSSIESVVLGWLADCPRILGIFRRGLDAYKDFGTSWLNKRYEDITKAERTICKPAVLGAGYRLGGGEIREGKKTGLWGYAENMGVMMTRDQAHSSVKAFRETYPEVPQFWFDIETVVERVMQDGKPRKLGFLRFHREPDYLVVTLPSGRRMYYFKPIMKTITMKSGRFKTVERDGVMVQEEETWQARNLTYMGVNQKTDQWERLATHGGKLTENFVQAVARDVLRDGLLAAHKAGFFIVGHVHDEVKTLRDEDEKGLGLEDLRAILTRPLAWAPGLPLGAAGWAGWFYRKD